MPRMSRIFRLLLAAATAGLACAPGAWALTVTASPAPGDFKESVSVALVPDVPGAKVSYSFDPEGSPNDYHAYSGEIVLTGSTPLVWYGFVDEKTESPISIEKYSFDYSKTFALAGARAQGGKVVGVGARNGWSGALSSAGWSVRSGGASSPLPSRRVPAGEAVAVADLAWSGGSLELVAPDGSVQDSRTAAQLENGVAYAPPSALSASLLDAGSSPAAWVAVLVLLAAVAGLVRALARVRRAHGGWGHAWRAARKAWGRGRHALQKGAK